MKNPLLCLFICSSLVAACSTRPDTEDNIHLASGDTVKLNKAFTIPDLFAHVVFQDGEIIDKRLIQWYQTSCMLDTNSLGPKTIAQNTFQVSQVTYNEDMYSDAGAIIRYYTEFHLDAADPKKNSILTCQVLDDTMQHHDFPLSEIRQATGEYFTFSSTDNK